LVFAPSAADSVGRASPAPAGEALEVIVHLALERQLPARPGSPARARHPCGTRE